MIKKIMFLFLILLILLTSVKGETIIIKDNIGISNQNKIIVFENGFYYGTYNYTQPITINTTYNYKFIINEDYVDYIQNEGFLLTFFKEYGYGFIGIIGCIIMIAFLVWIYNRSR